MRKKLSTIFKDNMKALLVFATITGIQSLATTFAVFATVLVSTFDVLHATLLAKIWVTHSMIPILFSSMVLSSAYRMFGKK
jgi:hypothetical protein